jgi:hypothetical protein
MRSASFGRPFDGAPCATRLGASVRSFLKQSDDCGGRFGLGNVYMKTGKLRLAEYHFQKAVAINPSNAMLVSCVGAVRLDLICASMLILETDSGKNGQAKGGARDVRAGVHARSSKRCCSFQESQAARPSQEIQGALDAACFNYGLMGHSVRAARSAIPVRLGAGRVQRAVPPGQSLWPPGPPLADDQALHVCARSGPALRSKASSFLRTAVPD